MSVALNRLLHDDFVSPGTDGEGRPLDDENVPVVFKAHRAALERLALSRWAGRSVPSTSRGFGIYWRDNSMSGS
ncbi:hypothetical protein [Streptomyces europaeiscabiei]|uniref:hypothetical protein n=1 Tax=Streptomyces europaeiscabiei TaxID=146819 RepID=UPI002E14FECA|nr:hypothetical protein OHB30_03270 [Streptomyces europaeiscabiei]